MSMLFQFSFRSYDLVVQGFKVAVQLSVPIKSPMSVTSAWGKLEGALGRLSICSKTISAEVHASNDKDRKLFYWIPQI
jgi:hypothetical protein